jgi:sorting nexin-29
MENVIGDYQSGFRQGKSTVDQIFTERQILEKCNEFGTETHHLFTDFRAANDSVDRSAMKELQIPKKLTAFVLTTLKNSKCQIKIQNNLSDPTEIKNNL